MRSIFSGLLASSVLLLAACGGGGGGSNPPPPAPPAPQAQSITFANAGPVTRPSSDGTYTNVAAGGAGTGAITYQSSNAAVATVNGSGVVTFVTAGSTTISANKAADANYLAASASYTLTITAPVVPQAQTIAFTNAGPISRLLTDGTYTNAASGGAGTGAITYQSSNAAVATVNGSGVVAFVTAGSTTISANKAADANYLAATANYTLTITNPISGSTSFTAWLGALDTQVSFPAGVSGIEFLRTTQLDCDLAQFDTCANRQSSILGAAPVLDTTAKLTRDAKWWLRLGSTASTPLTISLSRFGRRTGPALGSFRGKLWLAGGREFGSTNYVPLWNSDDGVTWTPVATVGNPYFASRSQLVEFNGRLFRIGGEGTQFGTVDDLYRDDIWSSADGITWSLVTDDAPWPGRFDHSSFVFDDRLWVVGGAPHPSVAAGNDAWSSMDGLNWVAETTNAPFYSGAQATVMNGRIWVVGGWDGAFSSSVYSSADGRTWRTETTSAPYPGRTGAVFQALNGRLYLAAGQIDTNNGRTNDVWSSADGINWVEEAHEAPFMARYWQGSTVHAGRLWMVGGEFRNPDSMSSTFSVYDLNDVWSTSDGSAWREHSPHAGGFHASTPDALVGNGRAWIVGGYDLVRSREETWSSTDGAQWTAAPAGTRFPSRNTKGLVWFNDELWIAGGATDAASTTQFADVWHSADGGSWTRATQAAAFGERYAHAMVVFNGEMFVIGGVSGTTVLADVWRSSDGVTWTQATAAAAFGPRAAARAAVFGGRLWLFGGRASSTPLSDAWSSADGVTWQLETATVAPLPRTSFSLTAHAGRLFIGGGYKITSPTITYLDDVWSSVDGITWTQVAAGPRFSPRRSAGFLSLDNKLWVLGGADAKYPYNDIWSSEDDGVSWRMRYSGQFNP